MTISYANKIIEQQLSRDKRKATRKEQYQMWLEFPGLGMTFHSIQGWYNYYDDHSEELIDDKGFL